MLTVIIAEKHIIEQYKQNEVLLAPFDNDELAFCEWNYEAGSIEQMLPDLEDIISLTTNWKAVVVTDNNKEALNPFDIINYSEHVNKVEKFGFNQYFIESCHKMFECYDLCLNNPLTRLSVALCEPQYFAELIDSDIYALTESPSALVRFVFKRQIDSVNTRKLVTDLRKFKLEQLSAFVPGKNTEDLLKAIESRDYSLIFELLSDDKLIDFLEFSNVGNCATYDAGFWYALIENTKKSQIFDKLKNECHLKKSLPQDVLYLAIRTCDMQIHNSKVVWGNNSESMYSNFVRYNLYNENIRFLVYDLPDEANRNAATESLKFQILLQILALYGNDAFSITKNKVFSVDLEYDRRELNRTLAKLIAKLRATALQVKEESFNISSKKPIELDNRAARLIFETDYKVPVQTEREYDSKNLMAKYNIGLSRNCPKEEMTYWDEQYYNIKKLFKRFLREPRRAVKKACTVDFRENNKIADIRAVGLTENQKEDITIKLEEEELNMVSTATSAIYDTAKYNKEIAEADKNIRRGIEQRMTRKKTLVSGIIAIIAYLIGFLPLIISEFNTVGSFTFSLTIIGIWIAAFGICGFIYLFVLKKKMINRFKHFNYVMNDICSEIRVSLSGFSKYLSHSCMVMRERSVLDVAVTKETDDMQKVRMLNYNFVKLEQEIDRYYKLLMEFSDEDVNSLLSQDEMERITPFNYDYTCDDNFNYAVFTQKTSKNIEYMLKGHYVSVPMICVDKVTLKREELYD